LKPLAVTAKHRSTVLPNVPMLEEAGIRGVEITGWQGIIAPKGTSPEIIAKLNEVFAHVQNIPNVRRSMETDGYDIAGGTPEDFEAFIKDEYERWGRLIEEEGIRPKRA
jgi:tripartite-type tricarboxylate transporter receptor subunit TctC